MTAPLAACAGARDDGDMFGSGASAGPLTTDDSGGEDGGGPGTVGDDGGTEGADETGGSGGGEVPDPRCDFADGCYMPTEPETDVGLASNAPAGCGGETFSATFSLDVASYADPEAPRSIPYLGDFDGDGLPDLLLNFRKASVGFVFSAAGQGTFSSTPAQLPGGLFAGGWGGDLGDLDGDGNLDVLLGDHTRSARAWTGNGAMGFTEARSGLPDDVWFSGAGLADLDGDGNLDAIFGKDQFASGFELYHGDGNGSWTSATPPPASSASNVGYFAFDDYDGDGSLDVFAFGRGGGPGLDAFVFHNDGGGFSLAAQLGGGGQSNSGADPVQGSIGDVNCDGEVDVAVGSTIYLGSGTGTWSRTAQVDDARISHLADMDGDGHLDVVTQHPSVGLALYLGDGTGTNWTRDTWSGLPDMDYVQLGGAFNTAYGIDVEDLDGNGALDIVRIAGFGSGFLVEAWTR